MAQIISVIKNNTIPGPKRGGEADLLFVKVDADPSAGNGCEAPVGTVAVYDSSMYVKTGEADNEWAKIHKLTDAHLIVGNDGGTVSDDTRIVVATIGSGFVIPPPIISLPSSYPVGVPLTIIRTDENSALLTATPESGSIDGGSSLQIPNTSEGPSGVIIIHDGTNWWTAASTTPSGGGGFGI